MPLVCSRRRAWSLAVVVSSRRIMVAFPMASVQCFWCHFDGSAVESRSWRPCHCSRDSNCGPRRFTKSSNTGVTSVEHGVPAYVGTATLAQPPPRKDSRAAHLAAGLTSRGLLSPQPPVLSGREACRLCVLDSAHPKMSSNADKTISSALSHCFATRYGFETRNR